MNQLPCHQGEVVRPPQSTRPMMLPRPTFLVATTLVLSLAVAASAAPTPAPEAVPPITHATASPSAAHPSSRNDYADDRFLAALDAGMAKFYARHFKEGQDAFDRALAIVPDNTLAISFMNAAAAQQGDALTILVNIEEDAVAGAPKNYVNHVRLGFSYLFQSMFGRDRLQDARDEFNSALAIDQSRAAAHIGLGIMRFNERSANRAKLEFLLALESDPNNVLAREYLAQIYQEDLRDSQRGLGYMIGVSNLVPQYADAYFHVGSLLYDLNQPEAALKSLQKGMDLDSGHVGEAGQYGYTLAARILIEQKKFAAAKALLAEAIDANVDTIYAKTLLTKLENGDYAPKTPPPNKS